MGQGSGPLASLTQNTENNTEMNNTTENTEMSNNTIDNISNKEMNNTTENSIIYK